MLNKIEKEFYPEDLHLLRLINEQIIVILDMIKFMTVILTLGSCCGQGKKMVLKYLIAESCVSEIFVFKGNLKPASICLISQLIHLALCVVL